MSSIQLIDFKIESIIEIIILGQCIIILTNIHVGLCISRVVNQSFLRIIRPTKRTRYEPLFSDAGFGFFIYLSIHF